MNKRKLTTVFRKIKEGANLDYAITNTDAYGDCNSCVNYELCQQFGVESKGIYAKHWLKGMNAGGPWKDLDGVYIGHDITAKQAQIMVQLLDANGYHVQPREYDPHTAFHIIEVEEK